MTNFTHGYSGYVNYDCRCDECRSAHATYKRDRRRRAAALRRAAQAAGLPYVVAGITHGKSSYANHSCRCEVCSTEWSAYWRRQRPGGHRRSTFPSPSSTEGEAPSCATM